MNNPLTIIHAIPVYAPAWQYGGPVLSVSRLCEALAMTEHRVRVLTTNAGLRQLKYEDLGRCTQRHGVEVNYFPVNEKDGMITSTSLEKVLPELLDGADIIHLSAVWQPFGIPLQRVAHELGIPVLHSLRGALSPYSWRRSWWKKIPYYLLREQPWLQRAAGLHVTTQQEENELVKLRLKAPFYQLANPIDLKYLQLDPSSGEAWRYKNGISPDIPLLLICGRQHHKKGLDLLIPVLQKLNQCQWKLLLVGNDDDGTGTQFVNSLNEIGLRDRLIQLPSQAATELGPIYNAADLLLLPSRHENFGNVVIESLACGCAVAVSDKTGVGGDLSNGAPTNFGAVLPREAGAWADWLASWLNNPQRAGKNCAQWIAQRYSSEAVAIQAVSIYQQILKSRQR
ncbi:Glycosyltransferase [Synechococcus sp. RCC307]|nr:Glycosyltransferase [Synechococcus sp. RCC307]